MNSINCRIVLLTVIGLSLIVYCKICRYEFNDAIVRYFEYKPYQAAGIRYNVVLASRNIGLRERVEYANIIVPDLSLEIHHDAAQPEDIERARKDGEGSPLWKDISGFSVHCSENNSFLVSGRNSLENC